jgi:hypothetical protein
VNVGQVVTTLLDTGPSRLYEETVSPNEPPFVEPYNLIRINDIKAGTPWLADTVDDSFRAWRLRVHAEVGYDFLAKLSDALRELSQASDTSRTPVGIKPVEQLICSLITTLTVFWRTKLCGKITAGTLTGGSSCGVWIRAAVVAGPS